MQVKSGRLCKNQSPKVIKTVYPLLVLSGPLSHRYLSNVQNIEHTCKFGVFWNAHTHSRTHTSQYIPSNVHEMRAIFSFLFHARVQAHRDNMYMIETNQHHMYPYPKRMDMYDMCCFFAELLT